MDNFESTLLRLKEQLSVRTDKEVAELLGLSVKAFTARKMRGAFPKDKLMALKAKLPDLDVNYVLGGVRQSIYEKIAKDLGEARRQVEIIRGVSEPAAVYEIGGVSDRESNLLQVFRGLDDDGKLAIEAMMVALASKSSKK